MRGPAEQSVCPWVHWSTGPLAHGSVTSTAEADQCSSGFLHGTETETGRWEMGTGLGTGNWGTRNGMGWFR